MERCNSLKRHRKETKPLSPIHILLKIVTQRLSLNLLSNSGDFPHLCAHQSTVFIRRVSPLFFPCFFFYISQESTVFTGGTALTVFTNGCGAQTVALNEMAPAPNCIPTWGRQARAEASSAQK